MEETKCNCCGESTENKDLCDDCEKYKDENKKAMDGFKNKS